MALSTQSLSTVSGATLGSPSFRVADLGCRRGGRDVFAGVAFDLNPGEMLVLRGSNGVGKSSLLRVLAGLVPRNGGSIAWGQDDVEEDPEDHRSRFHFVGHADPLKPIFTAAENLGVWVQLGTGQADPSAVTTGLASMTLGHLADVPGQFLSAGQRRRLNLSRLAAFPRPLWLLDEPTTALDVETTAGLAALMRTHLAAGGMIIASTHLDLDVANARVLQMDPFAVKPGRIADA